MIIEHPGTVLLESYIHLKPYNLKKSDQNYLNEIGGELLIIAKPYYKSELFIIPVIEEGSLKSKLTLLGALFLTISRYGEFRSGIDQMYHDAQKITGIINKEIINHIKPQEDSIYNIEKRTGVPGKIKGIIEDIDYISRNIHELSNNDIDSRIKSIKHRLSLALFYSNNINDKRLIINNIRRITEKGLPNNRLKNHNIISAWRRELEYLVEISTDEEFEKVIKRSFLN